MPASRGAQRFTLNLLLRQAGSTSERKMQSGQNRRTFYSKASGGKQRQYLRILKLTVIWCLRGIYHCNTHILSNVPRRLHVSLYQTCNCRYIWCKLIPGSHSLHNRAAAKPVYPRHVVGAGQASCRGSIQISSASVRSIYHAPSPHHIISSGLRSGSWLPWKLAPPTLAACSCSPSITIAERSRRLSLFSKSVCIKHVAQCCWLETEEPHRGSVIRGHCYRIMLFSYNF